MFTLGEIGYIDDDGYVFITDRFSDMVVSGGVNIYPAEAEQVLIEHPDVADVACIGVPHAEMGEELRALVDPDRSGARRPTRPSWSRSAASGCRTTSARARSSSSTTWAATTMGKINKRTLRAPYWENIDEVIDRSVGHTGIDATSEVRGTCNDQGDAHGDGDGQIGSGRVRRSRVLGIGLCLARGGRRAAAATTTSRRPSDGRRRGDDRRGGDDGRRGRGDRRRPRAEAPDDTDGTTAPTTPRARTAADGLRRRGGAPAGSAGCPEIDDSIDADEGAGAGRFVSDLQCAVDAPLAAEGDPIVIGFQNPEGDPNGSFPEYSLAAQAAVDYINAELGGFGADIQNGVPGRPDRAGGVQDGDHARTTRSAAPTSCVAEDPFLIVSSLNFFGNQIPIYQQAGVPADRR